MIEVLMWAATFFYSQPLRQLISKLYGKIQKKISKMHREN